MVIEAHFPPSPRYPRSITVSGAMSEDLRPSHTPGIHDSSNEEPMQDADAQARMHAQVLEAFVVAKQQREEHHALAMKQREEHHALVMKQRDEHHFFATQQRNEHHALSSKQRAEYHTEKMKQRADFHGEKMKQRAALQAQQYQQHEAAAAQLANLAEILKTHSKRTEQLVAQQSSRPAVSFWVQKESVASHAGVLVSVHTSSMPLQSSIYSY